MRRAKETVLEVNLRALEHNFNFLKSKIRKDTKFLAVVKASAYGSDAVEVARHLEKLNVDYFAVAYVPEGILLRNAGITTPILILHPQKANLDTCIEQYLEPNLYNAYILEAFIERIKNTSKRAYPVHLKFNTGLNRLGFGQKDIDYIARRIKDEQGIEVRSFFSHLVASEVLSEREFTHHQIQLFKKISNTLATKIGYRPLLHQLNTSGILNYAEMAQFDMVRSGIGLYGFGNDALYSRYLRPIAVLKSIISQIHDIKKGETVGYNRAFVAKSPLRTATIPIGHADGISRQYGNGNSFVTINGKKALTVGNVCMDMIMVDVSGIKCTEGDEVIFFGDCPTAAMLAENAGTISYELISSISQRIKRIIVK